MAALEDSYYDIDPEPELLSLSCAELVIDDTELRAVEFLDLLDDLLDYRYGSLPGMDSRLSLFAWL